MFVAFLTIADLAFAQILSNSSLSGAYYVRHIEFTTDSSNNVTDARSILGTITFDGAGNYTFAGQQTIAAGAPVGMSASGTYVVTPAGFVSLTNPQNSSLTINARYGTEAVFGSSTNAPGNVFDLFVAIPAPAANATPADSDQTLTVDYHMVDFELPAFSTAQVRVSGASAQFGGNGDIATFTPLGHAANVGSGATQTGQQYTGTYTVGAGGTGTIAFSPVSGTSTASTQLLSGTTRNLYVSASGNVFIAGTPGAHDILIGVQNAATDNIAFSGRYWLASLEVDSTGTSLDLVGSAAVISNTDDFLVTKLSHSVPAVAAGAPNLFTQTLTETYSTTLNGFASGGNAVASGSSFVLLGNDGTLVAFDPGVNGSGAADNASAFGILFGERIPTLTGAGVFVNPQGIVNAATFAPVGDNISPGEIIAIYGSGLAGGTASASALPYPTLLGGVTVSINGTLAPLYYVSPGQINCIVPYELTGSSATIVVTSGVTPSNSVTVGVVAATPGVISANDSGYGDGAITHANNTLVNSSSPAQPGETVQMYVVGLGGLTTPITDGHGAVSGQIDNATIQPIVIIDGIQAQVTYWGQTVDAGLYQINFVVPAGTQTGEQPVTVASTNGVSGEATTTITLAIQ